MNYVKIIVKSNYCDLRLFIKERETLKALDLIRDIHNNSGAGCMDYTPYRGHYKKPENELRVSMRKVRIEKKFLSKTLNAISERSFNSLETKLNQYLKAA